MEYKPDKARSKVVTEDKASALEVTSKRKLDYAIRSNLYKQEEQDNLRKISKGLGKCDMAGVTIT